MSACYAHTSSCFFYSSPPLLLFLFSHAKYIAIQLLSGSLPLSLSINAIGLVTIPKLWTPPHFPLLTPRCLSSALPFVCEPDRVFGKIPRFFLATRSSILSSSSLFPNPAQTLSSSCLYMRSMRWKRDPSFRVLLCTRSNLKHRSVLSASSSLSSSM